MSDPISFERVIDAGIDEAFAMFTEPERLRRWQAVSAAIDFRVEGEYRLTVTPGNIAGGTFTAIDSPNHLEYTWGWEGSDAGPGSSTVHVQFEAVGDTKTRVRLTHTGLDAEGAAGHSEGWNHYMDRLVEDAACGMAIADPWSAGPEELDLLSAAETTWALCSSIMSGFTTEDREKPTPCSEYNVHELVEHLIGSVKGLGMVAGAHMPDVVSPVSAEDQVAQYVEPALAAWRARGTDGEVPFGEGDAPAFLPASILSLEFLLHAWDFAQATNQELVAPPHVVGFVQDLCSKIIQPDNRGAGKGFAEEVPTDIDDAMLRLAAFTGRNV